MSVYNNASKIQNGHRKLEELNRLRPSRRTKKGLKISLTIVLSKDIEIGLILQGKLVIKMRIKLPGLGR